MNKKMTAISVFAIASMAISSFSAIPFVSAAKIDKDLKQNTRDTEVKELQDKLKEEGVFNKNVTSTGFFGKITADAVKQFQKKNGLPVTGTVDAKTRAALNNENEAPAAPAPAKNNDAIPEPAHAEGQDDAKTNVNPDTNTNADPNAGAETNAQINELMDMIKVLQTRLADAQTKLGIGKEIPATPATPATPNDDNPATPATPIDTPKGTEADDAAKNKPAEGTVHVGTPEQLNAGVFIHGGISGPGYPTGPLNLTLPASTLLFDRAGTGSINGELKDRQYEAPLETVPETLGSFPFTFNGVTNTATSLKVISNMKAKNGLSQHTGTIDIDIHAPGVVDGLGKLTLAYNGTATVVGQTVTSTGTFKTAGATGLFGGLVASGTYTMTIVESGTTPGAPVTVTLSTVAP